MRTQIATIVLTALMCAACNSGLENDYDELVAKPKASTSEEAKALFAEAKSFVERVEKTEDPPEGLKKKAYALLAQRGGELLTATARDLPGNLVKAFRDLRDAKLDPAAIASKVGVDPTAANTTTSTTEENEEYRRNADPTSDTIPVGKEEKKQ